MTRKDLQLVLAAFSVCAVGVLLGRPGVLEAFGAICATLALGGIVYGYNRIADAEADPLGDVGAVTFARAQVAAGVLAAVVSCILLSNTSRLALAAIATSGVAYSLSFATKTSVNAFRIKNLFVVKNVVIGLGWGLLILLGAGRASFPVVAVALFASIQVFIGSSLRDLLDIEEDRRAHVETLPVRLGREGAIAICEWTNAGSVCALAFVAVQTPLLAVLLFGTVIWRARLLTGLLRREQSFFTRVGNLAACHVMLLAAAVWRFV